MHRARLSLDYFKGQHFIKKRVDNNIEAGQPMATESNINPDVGENLQKCRVLRDNTVFS